MDTDNNYQSCPTCGLLASAYKYKQSFDRHVLRCKGAESRKLSEASFHPHLKTDEGTYTCTLCNKKFSSGHELGGHMSSHSKKPARNKRKKLRHKDVELKEAMRAMIYEIILTALK